MNTKTYRHIHLYTNEIRLVYTKPGYMNAVTNEGGSKPVERRWSDKEINIVMYDVLINAERFQWFECILNILDDFRDNHYTLEVAEPPVTEMFTSNGIYFQAGI